MLGSRELGQRTQGVDGTVCRSGRKTGSCVPTRCWTTSSGCSTSGWFSTTTRPTRQSSSIIDESFFPADGYSRIVRFAYISFYELCTSVLPSRPTFSGVFQIFFFPVNLCEWRIELSLGLDWVRHEKVAFKAWGTPWLSVSGSCADDRVLLFSQSISVARPRPLYINDLIWHSLLFN